MMYKLDDIVYFDDNGTLDINGIIVGVDAERGSYDIRSRDALHENVPEKSVHRMNRERAWNFAIGVVQLDGIKPSDDFLELVEMEKRGEITTDDIRQILRERAKAEVEELERKD